MPYPSYKFDGAKFLESGKSALRSLLIHSHIGPVNYICSVQSKNRYNSGIVLRIVGILTLSANTGLVPDNSRIAQEIYVENI